MRYQHEIEEILKISEGLGSKLLSKYYVLQAICGVGIWQNNDLASLGHKLANMSTLFKLISEIGGLVQDLEKKHKIWTQNSVKKQLLSIPYGWR